MKLLRAQYYVKIERLRCAVAVTSINIARPLNVVQTKTSLIHYITNTAACHSRLRHFARRTARGGKTDFGANFDAPTSATQPRQDDYQILTFLLYVCSPQNGRLTPAGIIINSFNYTIFTAFYSSSMPWQERCRFKSAIAEFSALAGLS